MPTSTTMGDAPGVGDQQPHPPVRPFLHQGPGPDPFEANSVPIPAGTRIPPGSRRRDRHPIPPAVRPTGSGRPNTTAPTTPGRRRGWHDQPERQCGRPVRLLHRDQHLPLCGLVTAPNSAAPSPPTAASTHAPRLQRHRCGSRFVPPAAKSDGVNHAHVAESIPGHAHPAGPGDRHQRHPRYHPGREGDRQTLQTYGAYVGDQGGAKGWRSASKMVPDATSDDHPGRCGRAPGGVGLLRHEEDSRGPGCGSWPAGTAPGRLPADALSARVSGRR